MSYKNKLYRTHLRRNSTLKRDNFFLFKSNVFGVMILAAKCNAEDEYVTLCNILEVSHFLDYMYISSVATGFRMLRMLAGSWTCDSIHLAHQNKD